MAAGRAVYENTPNNSGTGDNEQSNKHTKGESSCGRHAQPHSNSRFQGRNMRLLEIRWQRAFTPPGCCLSAQHALGMSVGLTCCVWNLKVTHQRCSRKCWLQSGMKNADKTVCNDCSARLSGHTEPSASLVCYLHLAPPCSTQTTD